MGYRLAQHGIMAKFDKRLLHAKCQICAWVQDETLRCNSDTKAFYRAAKIHVEKTGHKVELTHTHSVTYLLHRDT